MALKQESLNISITGDMVNKAVTSYTFSKRYTKIMVKASLLNIMYHRLLLNEKDLKTKHFEGVNFVVFKNNRPKDPLLNQYLAWVKGITDAIEKDYLREVFLYMKDPQNEELVETYRIYLKYNKDGDKDNKYSGSQLKQSTLELFQVIRDLGKHKKLDENIIVQIELTYLDATPRAYEPPEFEPSRGRYYLSAPKCNNHLATLKSGFHKLTYYGGGQVFNNRPTTPSVSIISEVLNEEQSILQEALDASTVENEFVQLEEVPEETEDLIPKTSVAKVAAPNDLHNISNITVSDHLGKNNMSMASGKSGSVIMTEEYFNCICMLSFPLDVEVIQCSTCKKRYHAPCHGYLNKNDAFQAMFTCIACDTNDQILLQFNIDERPLLARVRLILYFMEKQGKLPTNIMKLLDERDRVSILEKLECFNLLKTNGSGKINKVNLSQVLQKFFIMDNSQVLY